MFRPLPHHRCGTLVASLALASFLALFAGCGDDTVEAGSAADTTVASIPSVPTDAPFAIDGNAWLKASSEERVKIAAAYIRFDEHRCAADADPTAVAEYASAAYDIDFPLYIVAADVLAEGCDADRQ